MESEQLCAQNGVATKFGFLARFICLSNERGVILLVAL
jgi:hypothetical protein